MAISDHYGREIDSESAFDVPVAWRGGAVSGCVATLATMLVILPIEPEMFSETIAGMYGLEGVMAVGVLAHVLHGTLFGLLFAGVLSDPGVVGITNWLWKTVLAGIIFGLSLAVMATGFVLPAWAQFVGLTDPPTMPYVTSTLLAWHVLYGAVLGVVFPFLENPDSVLRSVLGW
ncbi:hypothetical protein [Halovenus sp. HT40]|uniref:hypothetical protein n=1 Tax=Halovenus sp. HT40 TaxID=3126691 RepID=UPI00300EB80E